MSMPEFFGNKVGCDLVIVRVDDFPAGTRPADALGKGTLSIEAPDSERARSILAIRRTKAGL